MLSVDPATDKPRGWIELERNPVPSAMVFRITGEDGPERLGKILFEQLPAILTPQDRSSPQAFVMALRRALGEVLEQWLATALKDPHRLREEHRSEIEQVLKQLRSTQAYQLAATDSVPDDDTKHLPEALAIILLAVPRAVLESWLAPPLTSFRTLPQDCVKLSAEVAALREQLETLKMWSQRDRGCCP